MNAAISTIKMDENLSKEDLLNYLLSYTSEWLENYYHPLGVMHPGTAFDTRPFNAENAANFLWSKLDD
jgi:hypothetical protein